MLEFKKVTLEEKDLLTPYFQKYGASSCQHSLYLMIGLSMKYGDEYAVKNGILYIHRSLLDREGVRVYLAPFGEYSKDTLSGSPVEELLNDADFYGAKLSFMTITKEFKNDLERIAPGRFLFEQSEDYAEYLYLTEKLSILPGKELASKRNRVHAFYTTYAGNIRIEDICESNIADVIIFQKYWIEDRFSEGYDEMLARENEAIKFYLSHFEELDFKGIVVYVKGTVVGYAAGVTLNDDCIDEVIEKGRKDVVGIYQLLCNEFAILCGRGYTWINREEDLGVTGLRAAKRSYHPKKMLEKFIVTEK